MIRPKALPLLEAALDDEVPVALAAAESLRHLGGAESLCTVPLLKRPEPELVLEAIRSLGQDGTFEDLDGLLPLVAHPDWAVRAEVIKVLGERSVKKAAPPILRRLEADGTLRFRDLFAGPPSRPRLVATFLALLELMRRQVLRARQETEYGEILLFRGPGELERVDDIR